MPDKKPFESLIGPAESTRTMSAPDRRISEFCSVKRFTLQRKRFRACPRSCVAV